MEIRNKIRLSKTTHHLEIPSRFGRFLHRFNQY
jgi:uncharacterized protein (DUF924 family)